MHSWTAKTIELTHIHRWCQALELFAGASYRKARSQNGDRLLKPATASGLTLGSENPRQGGGS